MSNPQNSFEFMQKDFFKTIIVLVLLSLSYVIYTVHRAILMVHLKHFEEKKNLRLFYFSFSQVYYIVSDCF